MSGQSSSSSSSGISAAGLLGVAFVVLKLLGYIDWSWWWVLAPFWGGAVLVLAILLGAFLFVLVKDYNAQKRRERLRSRQGR